MNPSPPDLFELELEAFEDFAASPPMEDYAMDAGTLQGLAAALAIGPRVISPAIWLPWVWDVHCGQRSPSFGSTVQANAVIATVMRQYNAVVTAFEVPQGSRFVPLYRQSAQWGAAEFCQGFMIGVNLAVEDWAPLLAKQSDLLAPIRTLAQQNPEAPTALDDMSLAAVVRDIEPHLVRIRDFWRALGNTLPPLSAQQVWEIVRDRLELFRKPFPHDAVALAHAHRETVAPRLVRVLEDLALDATPARDGNHVLHLFAMALLACWRDARAYRPLLALAHNSPEVIDDLFGDALTELYGRTIASVCDGDMRPLQELVDDRSVSVWVRSALLEAWKVRVVEGDAPVEPFERFLLDVGRQCAERLRHGEREPERFEMLDDVAGQACDIGSTLLLEPVRQWFAERLIDERYIDRPFFEREFALPHEERLSRLRRHRQGYIDDVAAEMRWWGAGDVDDDEFALDALPPSTATFVRASPKIGRNDPCPCGSGRKYKKCHGAN